MTDRDKELKHLSHLWAETVEAKRKRSSQLDMRNVETIINSLTLNNTLRLTTLIEMTKATRLAGQTEDICQAIDKASRLCSELAIYFLKEVER